VEQVAFLREEQVRSTLDHRGGSIREELGCSRNVRTPPRLPRTKSHSAHASHLEDARRSAPEPKLGSFPGWSKRSPGQNEQSWCQFVLLRWQGKNAGGKTMSPSPNRCAF
jgi:hypothetical protein